MKMFKPLYPPRNISTLEVSKLSLDSLIIKLRLLLLQQFHQIGGIKFKIYSDVQTKWGEIYCDESCLYEIVNLYGYELQKQKYVSDQMNIDYGSEITIQITDVEIAYVLEEKFFFDKTYKMPAIRIILSNNITELTSYRPTKIKKYLTPRINLRAITELLENPEDFLDSYEYLVI